MWLQQKYIGLISSRLERFKRVNSTTYNFRCPVCGDSTKNKYKARGYLFPKDGGGHLYHCHNCHITLGFEKFLKVVDSLLHTEYVQEKLKEKYGVKEKTETDIFEEKMKPPVFVSATPLKSLKKVSQLPYNHPVKQYVDSRNIPTNYHFKLFYAPKFKKFVNSLIPNKFDEKNDEPRLIIPFLNEEKKLIGFQGRAFSDKSIRYITIMLYDDAPKIFNLDVCDRTQKHFIFEGPIDSMFVKNSIAMAGQSINWEYCNENSVFVFDNEPRNKETCKKIEQAIDKGFSVVFFPHTIYEKDINDMILANNDIDIDQLLLDNIHNGLKAKLHLNEWRKI